MTTLPKRPQHRWIVALATSALFGSTLGIVATGAAAQAAPTTNVPTVTSTDYPKNGDTLPARTPGRFTFTPPAGFTPVSYYYGLNRELGVGIPTEYGTAHGTTLAPADPDGSLTVTLTPTLVGPNRLYVDAIDAEGYRSWTAHYDFFADIPEPAPFGDVTGDRRPDLIIPGTEANPGLWLYAGTDNAGHVAAPTQIGSDGNGRFSINGSPTDWNDTTVITADFTGDHNQDLLVKTPAGAQDGNLAILPGTGLDGGYETATRIDVEINRVDGESGSQNVDQVAVSPVKSVAGRSVPDLYFLVGDKLYVSSPRWPRGVFNTPILLGTGFAGHTITASALDGNPVLFDRNDATGELTAWIGNTQNGIPAAGEGSQKITYATTGFDAKTYPTITGTDINLDGKPDLWATTNTGDIHAYLSTDTNTFTAPVINHLQ